MKHTSLPPLTLVLIRSTFVALVATGTARVHRPAHADDAAPPPARPRYVPTPEELRAISPSSRRPDRQRPQVYKSQIAPHWFHDNRRFWYRNDLREGARAFIVVDVERGNRQPAFDHAKLAAALSKAADKEYQPDRLPFDSIEFTNEDTAVQFKAGDTTWKCDLASYECSRAGEAAPQQPDAPPQRGRSGRGRRGDGPPSPRSPDGKWTAFIKDYNVWLRPTEGDGGEVQLSQDGKEGLAYAFPQWAPDGKTLAAFRVEPGDRKEVYVIETSPREGGRAKLHQRQYDLPGDKLAAFELNLFEIEGPGQIKPEVERVDLGFPRLRWSADGGRCFYEKVDRGHQRLRLVEIDARTGAARNLIDESSPTFIWTAHTEMVNIPHVTWLEKSDELIYASERDGWRHLYLVDSREGQIKSQITRGEWVVRGIDRIDEDARQIWFRASGRNEGQDPYFIHYYRINFDGTGLVALTEGNGTHSVQFSPDRAHLIDTYSRVDMAPVHELRRTSDGGLVCPLEQADISELEAGDWKPPEVFVTKGRDETTEIWGIICRPRNFDPTKSYPVLESIYAGPQGSFVPKAFSAFRFFSDLTSLGFVVVQIDGMGTANRSKAFHDVCWKNLKDAGFPDRIAWHQAVAKKYPWYDLSRVGIFGTSAGGQSATGALLFHGDFYKAAASACGCHDNRMDKASWNEQWMGYPVGPHYADNSNITHADKLHGKLMLIVGELDDNVPPESTFRLADALIKAGKDFELLVLPGQRHSNGGPYGVRRMHDFFVRHLHGVEPPERNGGAPVATAASPPQPPRPLAPPVESVRPTRPIEQAVYQREATTTAETPPAVSLPPDAFFEKFRERDREAARTFYKKHLDVNGLPVAAAAEVADEALQRTWYLVTHLLAGRPDVLDTMVKNGTRLIIIGKDQVYTDMPEYRNHPNPASQNERVRGTGGFDVTSFGEENLLNLPLDRYDDESIAVHEFCHTIDSALGRIDPAWRERLGKTYGNALERGLWKNAYTASNPAEYWAEICQSYFDCNRINNWNHAAIGTREQLMQYDPEGYELVKTTFRLSGANDWRYRPLRRQPSVTPPPQRFQFDPYYTRFTYAREFPVLGSSNVSDEALLLANDTIRKLFAYRHDILKALIADGARLVVLGRHDRLGDLPELNEAGSRPGFDEVRFLDYTPERKLLVVPEENVLGLADDSFAGKSLVVELFARALYQATALRPVDAEFENRRGKQQYELRVKRLDVEFDHALEKLQEAATSKGLWKGTPAARSRAEYWAAGLEAYFDAAGSGQPPQNADRPITTREALKAYDPGLFDLVDETMAYREHVDWRFRRERSPD